VLQAISASLPMALGIALSPLPIAAIVMMLMTKQAGTNAPSFLLGWIVGLLVVGVIVFLIPIDQSEKGQPTAVAGYIRLVLGILLLVVAVRQWMSRPGPDDAVEVPRFLAGLDSFTGMKSLLTGFVLVALNPKNLPLCAAGAAAIGLATQTPTGQAGAYIVFTLIASTTIAFPIIAYLVARQKAQALFETWKNWLIRNNQAVVAVILLLVGALLVYRGFEFISMARA
jgi:Sec-independent protein secretion pathway component TatC